MIVKAAELTRGTGRKAVVTIFQLFDDRVIISVCADLLLSIQPPITITTMQHNNQDQSEQSVWRDLDQSECFTLDQVEQGLEHLRTGRFQLAEGRPVRVPFGHRGSRGREPCQ